MDVDIYVGGGKHISLKVGDQLEFSIQQIEAKLSLDLPGVDSCIGWSHHCKWTTWRASNEAVDARRNWRRQQRVVSEASKGSVRKRRCKRRLNCIR